MAIAQRRFGEQIFFPAFVMVVAVLLVGLLWSILESEQRRNREAIQHDVAKQAGNLARAFEEHVVRTFRDVDTALKLLRHDWSTDRVGFDETVRLMQTAFDTGLLVQIAVIGADGRLVYSSLEANPTPVDLSDREHFAVHRGRVDDQLFISKPVLGRVSGRYSIQVTRSVRSAQGEFGGVLVISLSPDYFARFFGSVDLGSDGLISLVGTDGVLRARGNNQTLDAHAIGAVIPPDRPFLQADTPASGSFEDLSAIDGVRKLFVYRRVEHYPMVVVVALAKTAIFAEHDRRWFRYRLWAGFFSLFAIGGGVLLARTLYLERRFKAQLLHLNESLGELNEVASRSTSLEERLQGALAIGRRQFCADFGVLTYMGEGGHQQSCTTSPEDAHATGTAELLSLVGLPEADAPGAAIVGRLRAEDHHKHPLLAQLEIHSYVSAPVLLGGEQGGAICFFSRASSDDAFGASDLEFMRLLGRWVGSAITEDRAMGRLRQLAMTDALTGAKSRGCFMTHVKTELHNAARHGQPLSLVLLDLDHFKHVNDSFGHPAGDEVLRSVTRVCQETLRGGDIFARLGGEEFAALLPRTRGADAMDVAERMRLAIAATSISAGEARITVTISAGVGQLLPGEDFTGFYNRVDAALYQAKQRGRNQVVSAAEHADRSEPLAGCDA